MCLQVPSTTEYKCYSDSMITLGWIKGHSNRWKAIVASRVQEIQNLSDPSCWHHCAGSENSDDLLTRGITTKALMNSQLWLHGPEWLSSNTCPLSEQMCEVDLAELATDELKPTQCVVTESKPHEIIVQINRWDSLGKAIRIVGWALRFTGNFSKKRKECATAAKQLLKITLKTRKSVTKASSLYKLSPSFGEDRLQTQLW
ncbi:integrase core domain protein [Plakobranchus ocellatus]|uniref:Integrase core domain protein n=1 Tax=Plakobranchus ocellatus TaxID=259542 RepID=A0AAV3Z6N5_9GAST|nr:integrase core domain protein [Plakobranchus ocellatus]